MLHLYQTWIIPIGTSSTLNQSMEDSKKSSFFSFGKKSSSVQNSKENISENAPSWKCLKIKKIKKKIRKIFKPK